jgi:hypothetical protein
MPITKERFDQGLTYEQWLDAMTRSRDRFEENEKSVKLGKDDLEAFSRPLNVAVIAEDWCGDVIANMPIVGRLAKETGKLNVRVFLRDKNPDLMDQYLNKGQFKSIPVFVFMDESFKELGTFIERPESVTQERARRRREMFAQHPEFGSPDAPIETLPEETRTKIQAESARIRDETQDFANGEVLKELRRIAGAR